MSELNRHIPFTVFGIPPDKQTACEHLLLMYRLRRILTEADAKYRKGEDTGMSDVQFDYLIKLLNRIEDHYDHLPIKREQSVSSRIGAEPVSNFKRVKHSIPMLSINNVYTKAELVDWFDTVADAASS